MDESVICIDDTMNTNANEIIDLSDTVYNSPEDSRTQSRTFKPIPTRLQTKKQRTQQTTNQPPVIDLSEESDTQLCKDSKSLRQSLVSEQESGSCDLCCPICFEKFLNISVKATTCGHVFCSSCIDSVVKEKKRCPTCRTQLTMNNLIVLYL